MPLGPKYKAELELHWQHQLDHVRADIRNITRRIQIRAELEAFRAVKEAFERDGSLVELHTTTGALEQITRDAVKSLPKGDS